ncbi:hypothetical protein C5167_039603 [Papaver somniferum]|uniref:Uncharacterized protein n=1 Tax=Papaver somniferum TaxID=3469 RepID=A0A4Y7ICT2_PAPSO|nr:hypothetical protein C5167_039603 [Papaver somniferum]
MESALAAVGVRMAVRHNQLLLGNFLETCAKRFLRPEILSGTPRSSHFGKFVGIHCDGSGRISTLLEISFKIRSCYLS